MHQLLLAVTLTLTLTLGAAASEYRTAIEDLEPMGLEGVDPGLANVLGHYYERNFSGADHWATVQSIRFDGVLEMPSGQSAAFSAYKKRPDYTKVVLFNGETPQLMMGFDGSDAWQFAPGLDDAPIDMPEADARTFIRDATTGGHLLYPSLPGKTIQLEGIVMFGQIRCYRLNITLSDGQTIISDIDGITYAEHRQYLVNLTTGEQELITFSDFRMVDGIRIPFESVTTVEGEIVRTLRITRALVNLGVTPWMFKRPQPEIKN